LLADVSLSGYVFGATTWAFLASGVISLLAAAWVWGSRKRPGGPSVIGLLVASAVWALAVVFEDSATSVADKILWSKVSYLGIISAPVLYLLVALQLAFRRPVGRRLTLGLWIAPVLALVLTWTNDWHGLIWSDVTIEGGSNYAVYHRGPAFWANIIVMYSYIMVGAVMLVSEALRSRRVFRAQAMAILLAVPMPWLASVAYMFRIGPFPNLDTTPIFFSFSSMVIGYVVHHLRFTDLMPAAHDAVFQSLDDGLVVIDLEGRIVDMNVSAARILDLGSTIPVGAQADAVSVLLTEGVPQRAELRTAIGGTRHVAVRRLPLSHTVSHRRGWVVVLQDVTLRTAMEEELKVKTSELECMVLTDVLTGLPNRRHIAQLLESELARVTRYEVPVCLAICDADHFKLINDEHGHGVGDKVLIAVGQALKDGARDSDTAGRFGGEEFVVFFPHTRLPEAVLAMERLRRRVSAHVMSTTGLKLTLSAGVSELRKGDTPDAVLGRADRNLYRAKDLGRDKVVFDSPHQFEVLSGP